jgi:nucleotide-binding universal stress UspA family protein
LATGGGRDERRDRRSSAPCAAPRGIRAAWSRSRCASGDRHASPISTRARSRANSRPAARAASDAEKFGPASHISTILICYDGSSASRQAVEHAGRLLPGSRAVVLNAWSWPPGLAACGLAGTTPHDFEAWNRAASDVAAEGVQRAKAVGLDAVARTTNGMVEGIWRSILALAGQCGVDLIVVGSRGLTGLRAIIAGSVSKRLVEHARLPVLVVPEERARHRGV